MSEEVDPYATPASTVDDDVGYRGVGPRSVSAGSGWMWIAQAWELFKRDPGTWVGIIVVFMIINVGLSLIPLVSILGSLLGPVFVGGIMLGCAEADRGDGLKLGHLFAGFSAHTGRLVLVGVMYLVGMLVIVVGIAIFVVGAMSAGSEDPLMYALAVLVGLAVMIPLLMAYWFAPVLIVLEEASAIEAMKMSFSACLKNVVPFLVYGLMSMLLLIVGMIPLGLGLLIVAPVLSATMYTAYLDIFSADSADEALVA